ncbi:UDP-N-acetylmuramate dehydrogenase [Chryseobacterium sp. A321]
MTLNESYSLKEYNTFGVEAKARYFAAVSTLDELKETLLNYNFLLKEEPSLKPPLFLGQGSNLLFTQDYDGLVIKLNLKGIKWESKGPKSASISAMAGENWHQFVLYTLEELNLGGLENLSLIPGNVGTSPIQNIGAYGVEIKDVFKNCKALNLQTLELEEFSLEQAQFGYRDSFFKKQGKGKYVITEVEFELTKDPFHLLKTNYGAISAELESKGIQNPSIQDISNAVISIRQSKLPNPKILGNAGSFFKNPIVSDSFFQTLEAKFPGMPHYSATSGQKVPAGYLIEQCGWKGKQIGNVAAHEHQALVLVNKTGKATGKEVFDFSEKIIQSVFQTFGITLEREVNIL